jgi:hypothetical protein
MTMAKNKRRCGLLAGAGLIVLAAGPLPAESATVQECTKLAAEAEQQMQTAALTDTQREYILDLIGTARTFAEAGDRQGCMENLTDLAEYVDQERIALPVAARIGSRPSAVGDTQEAGAGARGRPPERGAVEQQAEPTDTDERAPAGTGG